jgi:hypothetical protein
MGMSRNTFPAEVPKPEGYDWQHREYAYEQKARELERSRDHLETLYAGWIEKGFYVKNFEQCMRIAMKVELYNDIINELRRGRLARLEAESQARYYNRPSP